METEAQGPIFSDFIMFHRNQVPKELCEEVINAFETNNNEALICPGLQGRDGIKKRYDFAVRLSKININLGNEINKILEKNLLIYLEKYALGNNLFYSPEIKLQKTPPGGGFHSWHFEDGNYQDCDRELVWMIYMNDDYEGGETEFLYQRTRVEPEQGLLLIWPADFTHMHRGNMVLSDHNKYICTGWINRIPSSGDYAYSEDAQFKH